MAEYVVKAKPPLSFQAGSPVLKILDFGGGTLLFSLYHYAVTSDLTFFRSSISAGRSAASHTVCSWGMSS